MDIQFDKISTNHGVVSITLYESDYGDIFEKQLKHYAQHARLKGFRVGAVPIDLVKRKYGASILKEELTKMAEEAFKDYIEKEHIPMFMPPLLVRAGEAEKEVAQPAFSFAYEIGFAEEDKIVLDSAITVTEFELEEAVSPKMVEQFLEGLQVVHGQFTALEESTSDAMLHGLFESNDGSLELAIRIAVRYVPAHLQQQLVGLRVGSKVTLTEEMLVNHFPAILGIYFGAYACLKRDATWPATFTIHKINHVTLAPVEQALFDQVLGKGVTDSEVVFKETLSRIILFDKRTQARYALYDALREELFKRNTVHLPENFLKKWFAANNPGVSSAEIDKYYKDSEEDLKWDILLRNVMRSNDLKVVEGDVLHEAKRLYLEQAKIYTSEEKLEEKEVFKEILALLVRDEGKYYYNLYEKLSKDKAVDFIKKHISVIFKKVTIEEFDANVEHQANIIKRVEDESETA